MMNLKGSARKLVLNSLVYYPDIWVEELKKARNSSVRIDGVPAKFRTEHLPNTSRHTKRF
jgi:hypothetical protein